MKIIHLISQMPSSNHEIHGPYHSNRTMVAMKRSRKGLVVTVTKTLFLSHFSTGDTHLCMAQLTMSSKSAFHINNKTMVN